MHDKLLSGGSAAIIAICMGAAAPQAFAADAAAQAAPVAVGELVVVAQKRTEKLETVPVSVSNFTAKERDLKGISSMQDLTDYTPGFAYTAYDNRPFIRGVGRQTDNLAIETGVAIYVDGIYFGANGSTILQNSSLFVDQIEVLRGPQSTLYGRNADGGAINYISRRPTKDFEEEVRAGYANYDKWFVEGAVSGPITDHIRFRAGANYTDQTGGYYKNLNGAPEGGSVAQGGSGDSFHAEFQLEGDIGDKFDWWAKAATSDYWVTFHTQTLLGPLDTRENYDVLFPNQNYGLCAVPGGSVNPGCSVPGQDPILSVTTLPNTIGTNPSALNLRTFDADFKSRSTEGANIILATQLTYHLPGADLKYYGGFQKFDYTLIAPWLFNEGISSGVESYVLQGPPGLGNLTVNPAHTNFTFDEFESFFSHELNLSSTGNGPVQWIAGLYWYHENYNQPINVNDPSQDQVASPLLFTGAPAPLNPTRSVYNEDTRLVENSYAGFGQVDWKITPTIKLTGGLRYNRDSKFGDEEFRVILFDLNAFGLGASTFGAFTPAFDATSCPAVPAGLANFPGTGPCTVNPVTGKAHRLLSASWDAVTGTAGVSWTPDTETLAYLKYSRGYKTGGFNSGTMAVFPETQPETVDAIEGGLKKTLGRVFQANLAGFYYDYKNDQQPVGVETNGVVSTQIFNIPSVHTYGAELEAIWQPLADLNFSLSYAYLHATIAKGACIEDTVDPEALAPGANPDGCGAPVGGVQLQDVTGQVTPQAPHHKIALNALYTWRFEPGNLTLSGTVVWKSSSYDSIFNRFYSQLPSYSQVNLRATWTDAKDRFNVIVFCDNVFDTVGYDDSVGIAVTNPGPNQVIDKLVSLTAPRTFGVELQVRFR
jgi:iron complex outermembrane receptor protein